jgi:hypothetical protein
VYSASWQLDVAKSPTTPWSHTAGLNEISEALGQPLLAAAAALRAAFHADIDER